MNLEKTKALFGKSYLYDKDLYDINLFQMGQFKIDVLKLYCLVGPKTVWNRYLKSNGLGFFVNFFISTLF